MGRNPDSPWNPATAVNVTPEEYEKQVVQWLQHIGGTLDNFEVKHRQRLVGSGGEYEFDAVAKITIFSGAQIVIIVECKRYSRPVERKVIQSLWAKMQDTKAHKAMIFATCGFQSGAIEYASKYGIATIAFVEGIFRYETRMASTPKSMAIRMLNYSGILMEYLDGHISCKDIGFRNTVALQEWIQSDSYNGN